MFWKTDLLVKSGGEFTLIWLLAHDKAGKKAALNAAIADLDISAKCEALLKYQPTGRLNAEEVRNKMSLYLLAILQYGIVLAFSRKTDLVLRKLTEAIKLFKPVPPKKAVKRKSETDGGKAKRNRRNTTAVLQTIEEAEEEEQLIDLRNLPEEQISDRLRVTDLRQITLTEYDQQPQGFFEPDLRELENMMQFDADQLTELSREVVDRLSEVSREVVDQLFSRPGSRAGSVNDEMQSLFAELVNGMDFEMIALDPHSRHLALGGGDFQSTYLDPSGAELPRNDIDQAAFEELMEVDQQQPEVFQVEPAVLDPSLQLPTLNEDEILNNLSAPAQPAQPERAEEPTRRRRKVRNLIVDERIELTDAQIRRNLDNVRDICSTRRVPSEVKKVPTVKELLAPCPHFLPYQIDKRYELPAADGHQEEPADEIERFELPLPEIDFQEPIAEVTRPESVSGAEIARRSSVAPLREQSPHPMGIQQFDQDPQAMMDQTQFYEPSNAEFTQMVDQDYRAESPSALAPMDDSLLERIKMSKRGRERVEFMEFADQTNKTALVRDFVNLLHLLKHRAVRVDQDVAYGPILVETIEI